MGDSVERTMTAMEYMRHESWRALAWSGKPIFVGPWRSELGFETLYWLPWLTAWRAKYKVAKDRLIAVSRGGAGTWYDAGKTVELYDYAPVETIRQAMLRDANSTGSVKQHAVTSWERKLLPMIAEDLGIRRYGVLHPSAMYLGLSGFWGGTMSLDETVKRLAFAPIPVPHLPLSLQLPEKYVAVRFYARHTWPFSEEQREWVSTLVDGIAKHLPVVVLESGLHADDHVDFPIKGANITSLASSVTLQNNLGIQSAVLAKAQAFVGTYGGTMQLAVRLRKPAVGFYTHFSGTAYAHKMLTEWLGVQQKTPVFIGRPEDAKIVKDVMR